MIAILIAALGSASIFALAAYAQLRSRSSSEYATYAAAFFRAAQTLASCDEAPAEVLDSLVAFNETVADKRTAAGLLSYLSGGSRWRDLNSDAFLLRRKALAEFFARRPELEPAYHAAITNWFLAVTALSPLVGKLARIAVNAETVEAAAASRTRLNGDTGNFHKMKGPHPVGV